MPTSWLTSSIGCLHKKGSMADPANYRAISISATISRILPMIILDRLKDSYTDAIDQSQCGFLPDKGCTDAYWQFSTAAKK